MKYLEKSYFSISVSDQMVYNIEWNKDKIEYTVFLFRFYLFFFNVLPVVIRVKELWVLYECKSDFIYANHVFWSLWALQLKKK